jgi:hypothetical protein
MWCLLVADISPLLIFASTILRVTADHTLSDDELTERGNEPDVSTHSPHPLVVPLVRGLNQRPIDLRSCLGVNPSNQMAARSLALVVDVWQAVLALLTDGVPVFTVREFELHCSHHLRWNSRLGRRNLELRSPSLGQ